MARWLRFAVPRPLDPLDVLALHDELRETPRARTTVSHYTMLDASRTTLALVGFWQSLTHMQQEPDTIGTVELVLQALTGERAAVDTSIVKVVARPEDIASPEAIASPQRAVITDLTFAQPLAEAALTDVLDTSRDALQDHDGFRSCCLLVEPERPRIVHLSFWNWLAVVDVPGVEGLITQSALLEPAPSIALTSSARQFSVVGAHVTPQPT